MTTYDPRRSLLFLRKELKEVGATQKDFVLFGSMPMWFYGLREDGVGDIDVFIKPELWHRLRQRRVWDIHKPDIDDPAFLVWDGGLPPVHVFYDWTKKQKSLSVEACFELAEFHDGWPHAPLTEVVKWKEEALDLYPHLTKHKVDLEVLAEYMQV